MLFARCVGADAGGAEVGVYSTMPPIVQEFGKAKIYMLPQNKMPTLSKEVCALWCAVQPSPTSPRCPLTHTGTASPEKGQRRAQHAGQGCRGPSARSTKRLRFAALCAMQQSQATSLRSHHTAVAALQSNLTLEAIEAKVEQLKQQVCWPMDTSLCAHPVCTLPRHPQVEEAQTKLNGLRQGSVLVSKADREKTEKLFQNNMAHWSKRKRVFNELWYGPCCLFKLMQA